MNLDALIAEVAAKLPAKYEPLLLSFYGCEARRRRSLLIIGDDYGTELCLDPTSGIIRSIDPNGDLLSRFMNSSLEQLSQFIAAYDEFANLLETTTDAITLNSQLQLLRECFSSIDQLALAHPENWWSTILEQIEHGVP